MNKSLLELTNLNIHIDNKVILSNISTSIQRNDRIGLIGKNGVGKSTLLKHIATIASKDINIVYVPQVDLDLYQSDKPLYEYLSEQIEEWWMVFSTLQEIFQTQIPEDISLRSLSGGELTKIHICLALTKNPDLILFDEPTNHLDIYSIQKLIELLQNPKFAFVVVSHDIDFLNKSVQRIWELRDGALKTYGGNYDFYLQELQRLVEAQKRLFEQTKKQVLKTKIALQKENIKYQRGQAKLTRAAKSNDRSMPKIVRNALKLSGQEMHGRAKGKLESQLEQKETEMHGYRITPKKSIHIEFKTNTKKGLLFNIQNGTLIIDGKELINNINLTIYSGDRIAITGANGTGKTLLLNQLSYEDNNLIAGEIEYGNPYRTVYVNQKYDLIDSSLTILDNLRKYAVGSEEELFKILGSLGFSKDRSIYDKASILSGGELARLAFGISVLSEFDLMILDEPTNNLDIDTKERIIDLLESFGGTLIVVSHDLDFLNRLGISKPLAIKSKELLET